MTDELQQRIHDAMAACRAILDFTTTASFESYTYDLMLRSAVERQFEILGEALNNADKLDLGIAEKLPDLPRIVGMRKKSATEYAFDVLDAVAQGDFTKWQVVYDIPRRRIHFRTLRNRKTKLITLSEFDFDHAQAPFMLDINIAGEGNMRPYFMKHTDPLNDELIKSCLEAFKKANIMQHIKPEHIEYIRHTVNSSKSQ